MSGEEWGSMFPSPAEWSGEGSIISSPTGDRGGAGSPETHFDDFLTAECGKAFGNSIVHRYTVRKNLNVKIVGGAKYYRSKMILLAWLCIQGLDKFFDYSLLSQERVKLRTSNFA